MTVCTTPVASLQTRRRAKVAGVIVTVRSRGLPSRAIDVELDDGTGVVVLRFLGRSRLPGLEPGRRILAEGTPSAGRDGPVILNPIYCFDSAE